MFKPLTLLAFVTLAIPGPAFAAPECGGGDPKKAEDKQKWLPEAEMQKKIVADGYKIKKFKIDGNCYEIYGWDKDGAKVEIYFNPITGAPVKTIRK